MLRFGVREPRLEEPAPSGPGGWAPQPFLPQPRVPSLKFIENQAANPLSSSWQKNPCTTDLDIQVLSPLVKKTPHFLETHVLSLATSVPIPVSLF